MRNGAGRPIVGLVRFPLVALVATAVLSACGTDTSPASTPTDSSDGGSSSGAPASSNDPVTGRDAGPVDVDCPNGSAVEVEPNDTPDKATDIGKRLALCGAITPGTDVDYSTFTTPAGKKLELFQGIVDGAVDFDLVVNGKTLKPKDVESFEPGTYVVKAYTTDGQPARYRYRVQYAL